MSDPNPKRSREVVAPDAICGAKTRSGGVCTSWPVTGGTRCRMHGGASPQAQRAARRRVLEASIRGEAKAMGWEPVTDPIAEFADLAGEILAFRDLAREQVNALDTWDAYIGRELPQTEEVFVQAEQVKAVIEVYERSLDRAERTLARMVQHGLDAATIQLAMQERAERPTMAQAAWAIQMVRRFAELAGVDAARADEVLVQVTKEAIEG